MAHGKEFLRPTTRKFPKILFLSIFSCLLLIAAALAIAAGVNSRRISPAAHAILKSSCSSTRYPDLCYSAVASAPGGAANGLLSRKNVIEVSLNLTEEIVRRNYFSIKNVAAARRRSLTRRERAALHDCLEMVDETLDEIHRAIEDLEEYPGGKKSLERHAEDLKTLLSAAMTNQETCLDGFSHDNADKGVRKVLLAGEERAEQMCSNVLAMIKNMTDSDMIAAAGKRRRLLNEQIIGAGAGEWPEWLSVGDRRLLQSGSVPADTVVALDGTGNHRSVAAAVAAAPKKSAKRYVIKIKAGVYRENVEVPKSKTNIMFMGEGRKSTIITGSRNVASGATTTFRSATVAAVGERFLARDITFENTAGSSKHQAVALRVGSDLSAFYQCDVLAHQDSLYVHSNRQFFVNCLVAGTVDFIFGNAAAVFQDCDIHARLPNPGQKNMVTAQSRADPNQNTGIVLQRCRIGATTDLAAAKGSFPTYLGRPWKEYSRTVVMQSTIGDVIHPAGWHEWNGPFALDTLYYAEHGNSGAGAPTANRVSWKGFRVIPRAEAQQFAPGSFLGGASWLPSTGFPFSLA